MLANPFEKLPVANEAADRRRIRQPLSTDELTRLLYVTKRRPLAEYGRKTLPLPPRKCEGRKTWAKTPLTMATLDQAIRHAKNVLASRPDFIAVLEARGRRNAMFYRLAAFTGPRKSELASIVMRDVHLDTTLPYLELRGENEKAGRGAKLPLKTELAEMVRKYVAERCQMAGGDVCVPPLDIRLTTNIYQHLELVDTAGAVEMLPSLGESCNTVAISAAV